MLAVDADTTVRQFVALNPNAPAAILARLAGDMTEYPRQGVAGNPSTPADILTKLARDDILGVWHRAVTNPNVILESI